KLPREHSRPPNWQSPARFWPSVKPWLTVTEGDEPRVPPEGICTSARLAQAQEAVKNRESHVSRAPAAPAFPSAAITEAVSAPLICGGGGRRRATRSAGLNRHCGVRTGPGGSGRGNGNRRRPTRSGRQAGATGDGGERSRLGLHSVLRRQRGRTEGARTGRQRGDTPMFRGLFLTL